VTVITPGAVSSITSTVTVSIVPGPLGFFVRACFRAIFFAGCLGLSFALRFFGVALAPDFFVVVLRTDEILRVLLRAIDFRFLAVARFFPLAMIATLSCGYLKNACSVLAELQRIQVERLTRILSLRFAFLPSSAGRRRPVASDTIGRLCGNVGRIRILTDGLDLAR
jgi:hypothetical protein